MKLPQSSFTAMAVMILLSITGIIYLFKPQLDAWMYADLMQVPVAEQRLSADQQLAIVREAYPQALVSKYLPPAAQDVVGAVGGGAGDVPAHAPRRDGGALGAARRRSRGSQRHDWICERGLRRGLWRSRLAFIGLVNNCIFFRLRRL